MRTGWQLKVATAGVLAAIAATSFAGQITLYPRPGFQGRAITTGDSMSDLWRSSLTDTASSVVVSDGAWEACTEANFRGRCAQLVPGNYGNLSSTLGGMIVSVRQIAVDPAPQRIVVYPDGQQAAVATANAPVVINPGAAPVVISAAPPPQVVYPQDSRGVVVSADRIPVPAGPRITLYENTARGMRAVGAEFAAQLDVNYSYPRFLFFDKGAGDEAPHVGSAIIPGIKYTKSEYVGAPEIRDFFYLTRRRPSSS